MDPQKPSDPDAEAIDAELKFHFSETVEALVERGWPETVARAEAERRFGNRERYRRRLEKIGRQGRQVGSHLQGDPLGAIPLQVAHRSSPQRPLNAAAC